MKTKITIGIIAVFIIGLAGVAIYNSSHSALETNPYMTSGTSAGVETTNPNALNPSATTSASSAASSSIAYTLAQVAQHSNSTSCWTAINGKVYDVTKWINQHPGGPDAILSLCGKDGSAAFNGQHGGQRRPAQELATFYIGDLAQ